MKKTILAAAIAALVAVPAAAQDKMQIRIGTEGAYPPFNYFDSDRNLVGFDIDIANALCDAMDAECTFVTQDWDGIIPALRAEPLRRDHRLHVHHAGARRGGGLHQQVLQHPRPPSPCRRARTSPSRRWRPAMR